MGFPVLIAAIRASGLKQWHVAQRAGIPESRLSRIGRHGGASRVERETLSRLLGVTETVLFGPGPAVKLRVDGSTVDGEEADRPAEHVAAADVLKRAKQRLDRG